MLSLFHRKSRPAPKHIDPTEPTAPAGLTRPQSAKSLLATPRREKLLRLIWQHTAVSRPQFNEIYLDPISRYAELVQLLPASESHHHAYPGGMLDHGLEVVIYALKLRQSYLLPSGAQPEVQIIQAEAWTAALVYAALGHDLGKVAVDVHVEYGDGRIWHPWQGPLSAPYRALYKKNRQYRLHGIVGGVLIHKILNSEIMDWLSTFPELWTALMFNCAGQNEHAGELGILISKADQASVAQALGGDPTKAMAAPKHALQRKLLEGLRYLLSEELKLNQPQASDGWLTQEALWLVSKTVSDKLRAHLLSQGVDGIPEQNIAIFNVLQEHGIALPNTNGKAIWKATVTSETGWSHSFTFLKLSPAMIWDREERPDVFTGSVAVIPLESPTTLSDDASTHHQAPPSARESSAGSHMPPSPPSNSIAMDSSAPNSLDSFMDLFGGPPAIPESFAPPFEEADYSPSDASLRDSKSVELSGAHFMEWLTNGLRSHRIIMNDANALVHTVSDTLYLVTPGVFLRYAQEHPHLARIAKKEKLLDWEWIQKRFEELKLHRKQPNDLNIWICEVSGARKTRRLYGYLLKSHEGLMNDLALNNPYLKLLDSMPRKRKTPTLGNTR
ncbi:MULTISPECIES: MobH family relaxase [unclassified Pseudomonas]|uniref:MobH family relaxase n=1 Tax=unclassified Pseudomonas TaxID=196821 RepID=UPI000876A61D|nr:MULTISPECIES: MobH family relaxase [unclassified Pseudomonas]SCZ40105.1 integrating conjugative element relaxase, PFL_4751 family [Pseudomonas sp. NFACC44-2]SDA89983.1 integrating conjugative element relaxase, PFL_4751 family [Pseudomonas sp. NFACC51]SDW40989.1 integrating conjugative element relaxase, PFL_4751 family [Pseudomonas sp. NFACC08-1]SFI18185.1 integrating conjugative element relaxase, PFL_4751 family [Pseudomonas sp. NFACC54]SFT28568.1 integrating conjugative element relaxase, P